ncbi:MAG TPA: hypothetical protein DEB17_09500 [Chlorobaculum sp.]|uniref:Uncharacterized protein n=1 Tax=Chlorobaculum tepidum (strain ATCC 49652 / DSM 12025 / NBRC 103806 / TLS) TaxID=194439 RepID=Q8KBE4_CHLTE|nr:hypothetical protein CT1844 [Chlorobaculum tepidum TLS]HBU24203.1 hypothetical protein [Chlorobaculum sp.]
MLPMRLCSFRVQKKQLFVALSYISKKANGLKSPQQ